MIIYMAVTNDKYELPLTLNTNLKALAKELNINYNTIRTNVYQKMPSRDKTMRFVKVNIEED